MAYVSYTTRDGKLRLYDKTGTPFFLELGFVQAGFRAALGVPVPTQRLVLDRGRGGSQMHNQEGDDSGIFAPQTLTFTFMLANTDPNWKKWAQAMNLPQAATWTVGSNTWITTKGTTQRLAGGESPALVCTPAFVGGRRRTVNVEVLWNDPQGTLDIGRRWSEVEFEPDKQQVDEQTDAVMVSASGMVYGAIEEITAFTAGTAG